MIDAAVAAGAATVPWRTFLTETTEALASTGRSHAEIEARRIVEEATGYEGAELILHLDEPATTHGVAAIDRMLERRLAGEPLQYVLGRWAFRHLDLMVDERVLIPRPETEGVVDHVLRELDRVVARRGGVLSPPAVVDLGCGSGAIALAVASERPGTEVHAVDSDPGAAQVTRANLAGLGIVGGGVSVREGSWFDPLPSRLERAVAVVVSNPPYVAQDDELPDEVRRWEPVQALVAGPTGLESIDAVVNQAQRWLKGDGALVVEIGESQGDAVRDLAASAGFDEIEIWPDLNGRDRVLVARAPTDS